MATNEPLVCHFCGFTPPPDHDQSHCPRDGLHLVTQSEHDKAPEDRYLGTTVGGRYPLLGILGSGGMGTVYRSAQPLVDRPVAVKLVQPVTSKTDDTARRFLREARAIASVSHPAIVMMFDFGVDDDGTAFMVMEYVAGQTLREKLEPPGLTLHEVRDIVLEILGALDAAHAAGLIHRDLKPENVMLLAEPKSHGRVKILDFGLAKLADHRSAGPKLTRDGMVFGTPGYMAPEQVTTSEVDARVDLYSVGVILFEGLVGRLPFDDVQPMLALQAHLMSPVPPLPDYLPKDLESVIHRAMAKKPADRFDSAAGMAVALRVAGRTLPLTSPGREHAHAAGGMAHEDRIAATLDGAQPGSLRHTTEPNQPATGGALRHTTQPDQPAAPTAGSVTHDSLDGTKTQPTRWRQLACAAEQTATRVRALDHDEGADPTEAEWSFSDGPAAGISPDAAGPGAPTTALPALAPPQAPTGPPSRPLAPLPEPEAGYDPERTATSTRAIADFAEEEAPGLIDKQSDQLMTLVDATVDDVGWPDPPDGDGGRSRGG